MTRIRLLVLLGVVSLAAGGCGSERCLVSAECGACSVCVSGVCMARSPEGCSASPAVSDPKASDVPYAGPMAVDGELTDWRGVARHPIEQSVLLYPPSGAEDLSAQFALQWNSVGIYGLFEVSDDVVLPPDSGEQQWDDDSAAIVLDLHRATKKFQADGGVNLLRFRQHDATRAWPLLSWQSVAVFRLTDTGYLFEFLVLWPSQSPPVAGTVLGVDAVVDDDDDGGPGDHELRWATEALGPAIAPGDYPFRLRGARLLAPVDRAESETSNLSQKSPSSPGHQ